jgi:hypothetical protein
MMAEPLPGGAQGSTQVTIYETDTLPVHHRCRVMVSRCRISACEGMAVRAATTTEHKRRATVLPDLICDQAPLRAPP